MAGGSSRQFRFGLIQLAVGYNKAENVKRAVDHVKKAADLGCQVVALPECFNSPYGPKYFPEYAEEIPDGDTVTALSKAAKDHNVYLIGGSIPEKSQGKIYNTCTVWSPEGDLLALHRKMHLFDIDIPGGIRFKESEIMSAGSEFTTFRTNMCKIGIGICYDVRFEEMARIYRNQGCEMIVYPGAFNMKTGPLHWELLMRSRAIDNQVFVAGVAPAQVKDASYLSYGHSLISNPWGTLLAKTEFDESIIYADIDLNVAEEIREQIPIFSQRRTDLYNTVVIDQLHLLAHNILAINPIVK